MPIFGIETTYDEYFHKLNQRAETNTIFNYFGRIKATKVRNLWIMDVNLAMPPLWQIGLCIIAIGLYFGYFGGFIRFIGFASLLVGGAMFATGILYTNKFYYYLIRKKVPDARYVHGEELLRRLV
jgi:hypothetical protein